MAFILCNPAGRVLLRRPHIRGINIPKRHTSNNTQKKVDVDPSSSAIPIANTVPAVSIWQRLGPFTRFAQAFGRSQKKRPYTTQFATSLVIWLVGDLSAQRINGQEYESARTARALILSAGCSIPSFKWLVMGNGDALNHD